MPAADDHDPLAGWQEEVVHEFHHRPDLVFSLLTDVVRMASFGPEHVRASWETEHHGLGAWFLGANEVDGRAWELRCQVIDVDPPATFAWAVGKPAARSSTWRYELAPTALGTSVRQTFRHGPGFSYVRRAIEQDPGRTAEIVQDRGSQLRRNMAAVMARAGDLLDAEHPR